MSSSQATKALTPYHSSSNFNHTFNVSHILPFASDAQQDAATIAAEVSAAAVAQVSKEFCCMHKPKLKGSYLADAELVFGSWYNIKDCELDNVAPI